MEREKLEEIRRRHDKRELATAMCDRGKLLEHIDEQAELLRLLAAGGAQLQGECERLRVALRPFAEVGEVLGGTLLRLLPDVELYRVIGLEMNGVLRAGDARRAFEAMRGADEEDT